MAAIPGKHRYNTGARFFHWIIALLMIGMYATVWIREGLDQDSAARPWLMAAHMSFGLSIFGLTILRVLWRLSNGAPAPVPAAPMMALAARLGHAALYLFTLGLPITGALRMMTRGRDVIFYGLSIPSLTGENEVLRSVVLPLHNGLLMNLLLALIAGHVLAALWHQLVLKDGTLRRMA